MKRRIAFHVCSFSTAAALLWGCAGSQLPVTRALSGSVDDNASRIKSGGSWMLSEAKNERLIYVGNYSDGSVLVYTFGGKLVGTLSALGRPAGMCSDQRGDVWVTNFSAGGILTEFAHGGTKPIATLPTPKTLTPQDCSIDPTTGDLALVGYGPEKPNVLGRIVVYPKAHGRPKVYKVSFGETSYCSYDGNGNLFIDGFGYYERPPFVAAELVKGASSFTQIAFSSGAPALSPTPVQWDGQYITYGGYGEVFRYTIQQNQAIEEGSTDFDIDGITDYWIQGNDVVATSRNSPVRIFNYPAGGKSIKSLQTYALGVTVSAPNNM